MRWIRYLILFIAFIPSKSLKFSLSFNSEHDRLLCNNQYPTKINSPSIKGKGKGISDCIKGLNAKSISICDERKISDDNCLRVELQILDSEVSPLSNPLDSLIKIEIHNQLRDLFDLVENNQSLRRVSVTYPLHLYSTILPFIDEQLLAPKFYLFVRDQSPHSFAIPNIKQQDNRGFITIDKYHHKYENHLKWLGSVQFLAGYECKRVPLLYLKSNGIHPGWGSIMESYSSLRNSYPYGVSIIHVSDSQTGFISDENCPSELKSPTGNRWLCAFLPVTNCSLPNALMDCIAGQSTGCDVSKHFPNTDDNAVIFMNFNSTFAIKSQPVEETLSPLRDSLKNPQTKAQVSLHRYSYSNGDKESIYFLNQLPYNRTSVEPIEAGDWKVKIKNGLFQQFFLFRPNHYMRNLIDARLRQFRILNSIDFREDNFRCVAAHIRRGDRVRSSDISDSSVVHELNITQYCIDNKGIGDLGCGEENIPFASITLSEVISRAENLVSKDIRNLVVLVEDDRWFNAQREKVKASHSHWNIYSLPFQFNVSNSNSGNGHLHHSGGNDASKDPSVMHRYGTRAGVHLLASLKLVQHCEALVAHFGSAFSKLVYATMCVENKKYQGVCPPVYDFRSANPIRRKQLIDAQNAVIIDRHRRH